jgi:hypothetical protein
MIRVKWSFLLLLTACTSYSTQSEWGQRTPARKEELKLLALQRKLDAAEGEKQRALDEVNGLHSEIQEAQIAFVAKQLNLYERQLAKLAKDPEKYGEFLQAEASLLFLKEREMLHEMIRSGSPTASFEAQQMLDRILRLITELNDEQRLDSSVRERV